MKREVQVQSKAPYEPTIDLETNEVQLWEPLGPTPPYWQEFIERFGSRVVSYAVTFGHLIPEYTMLDYINLAVDTTWQKSGGYETVDVWGVQGSKKSCRTCIISHWVYQEWDVVLDEIVLLPDARGLTGYEQRGFLQKMQSISKEERNPLLAWDDMTVSMPSASFKTDVKQYAAVDGAWAAIRTKVNVMVLNNPLIDRLGKNIKDNITLEVYLGRNQVELIERFVRLVGLKTIESNFFKIQVEPIHVFDYHYMPKSVFEEYFDLRKEIADYAIHKMGKAFGDEASLLEDMVGMKQMWAETPVSLTTLNDMIKRNFIEHEKINGKIYVKKQTWQDFLEYMASEIMQGKGSAKKRGAKKRRN